MVLYPCFSFPFLLPSSLSKSNEKMSLGEDKKKNGEYQGDKNGVPAASATTGDSTSKSQVS